MSPLGQFAVFRIPDALFEAAAAEAKRETLALYNYSDVSLIHSGEPRMIVLYLLVDEDCERSKITSQLIVCGRPWSSTVECTPSTISPSGQLSIGRYSNRIILYFNYRLQTGQARTCCTGDDEKADKVSYSYWFYLLFVMSYSLLHYCVECFLSNRFWNI